MRDGSLSIERAGSPASMRRYPRVARTHRILFALAVVAPLLTACITGDAVRQVEPGMSRGQVIKILGHPDGFESAGDYEALNYANRLMSGWSWDRTDYHVILHQGRVVSSGNGHVRQNGPNILILVPLTPAA
jgi:hypothetical protein